MPSLPLGKLLSGGSSKSNNAQGSKKPLRGWSSSSKKDKGIDFGYPSPVLPTPPINCAGGTPSTIHGSPARKKRSGYFDLGFDETDDYGFDVRPKTSGSIPSRRSSGKKSSDSERILNIFCYVCHKAVRVDAAVTREFYCDQCRCVNVLNSTLPAQQGRNDFPLPHGPQKKPLSVSRTAETLDLTILDFFKIVDERHSEEPKVPQTAPTGGPGPPEHISSNSSLVPPSVPLLNAHRRGSAPDVSRPLPRPTACPPHRPENPRPPARKPPPVPISVGKAPQSPKRSPQRSPQRSPRSPTAPWNSHNTSPRQVSEQARTRQRLERNRRFFEPFLDSLVNTYGNVECLNSSFSTIMKHHSTRSNSEGTSYFQRFEVRDPKPVDTVAQISEMDHKDLIVGDVYDVASSLVAEPTPVRTPHARRSSQNQDPSAPKPVNLASAHIDWKYLHRWYDTVLTVGAPEKLEATLETELVEGARPRLANLRHLQELEHIGFLIRTRILEITEHMIVNPRYCPKEPADLRYLLILLSNPLLKHPKIFPLQSSNPSDLRPSSRGRSQTLPSSRIMAHDTPDKSPAIKGIRTHWSPNIRSRILSLIFGVLANLNNDCHLHLVNWFSRYPEDEFRLQVDMVLRFINERIALRRARPPSDQRPPNTSSTFTHFARTSAYEKHYGIASDSMFDEDEDDGDWQLRVACKVMQLFVRANDIRTVKKPSIRGMSNGANSMLIRRPQIKPLLPTDYFYSSFLDSPVRYNPKQDLDAWESKRPQFSFCQYPFLLSLGTKIKILQYDGRRKMADKARQEFFDSIFRSTMSPEKFFHLTVRRTCLIEDSLQRISEAIYSSQDEAKKALKVKFEGEEGVDGGGLRKEWFLLLVRELFDPSLGLFIYNEESNFCYFNPHTFESSEQYQLVGAVLGLAIYNFTILDVPLPPFLFRKLVAAAPPLTSHPNVESSGSSTGPTTPWTKSTWRPTLSDLAEYQPDLARGLAQLLEYEGDVMADYGWTFEVPVERYGTVTSVPLFEGGENRPVTKFTREEFVDAYVEFLLDRSVKRQFEPFVRGFYRICAGNALSLFRGEEIELLIRGSGELDFGLLRNTAVYDGWKVRKPETNATTSIPTKRSQPNGHSPIDSDSAPFTTSTSTTVSAAADPPDTRLIEAHFPVLRWFWELMQVASPRDQQRVLRWITGSDRIPAAGMANLTIRIQYLGEDCERLPQARTCFNCLQLWNYASRGRFVRKFWCAVVEGGEGFGMK